MSTSKKHIVRSQSELDAVPLDYAGTIEVYFGTRTSPALIRNRYKWAVQICRGCFAVALGKSFVQPSDSTVIAKEQSKVRAKGHSLVYAHDKSYVDAYGTSHVITNSEGAVNLYDSSHADVYGDGGVESYDESTVWMHSGGAAFASDESAVLALDDTSYVDRSNNATVSLLTSESTIVPCVTVGGTIMARHIGKDG